MTSWPAWIKGVKEWWLRWLSRAASWFSKNVVPVIAFAALGLAVFQGWATLDTAKKQLRAYLQVETRSQGVVALPGGKIQIYYWLHNVGQTPAYITATHGRIFIGQYPFGNRKFRHAGFDEAFKINTSPTYIGGGINSQNTMTSEVKFSDKKLEAMRTGKDYRLFLVAIIYYDDIHSDRHYTQICRVFTGRNFDKVELCKQGEHAS